MGLASALSVGALQSASAADIYQAPPPAAVVVRNWTGCYGGVNGGYASSHKHFIDIGGVAGDLGSHTSGGGVAGGQVGCDYQTGPWVLGIRGMFDGTDVTGSHIDPAGTSVINSRFRSFETVVGRVGYSFLPETQVYVLGGLAVVQDRYWVTTTAGAETANASVTRTGFDLGIGLEHMFAPGWSAFIEYDYIHCGCVVPMPPVPAAPIVFPTQVDVKQEVNNLLVGVNYRF